MLTPLDFHVMPMSGRWSRGHRHALPADDLSVLSDELQSQTRIHPNDEVSSHVPGRFQHSACNGVGMAISGAHVIIYSEDPEADRRFFRDVLRYSHVDAGDGWLIFKLPPAEVAVHPGEDTSPHELYLMCDNLDATMNDLGDQGVAFADVAEARWGRLTHFTLPGGSQVGLYQPRHPRASDL